ncbi:unnamed protein product [Parnassius mnemosyne]|uniref:DDE Tnp4 domain-containing protein n=1 Tax=Parnassius mnemosyne TaxID=213953 RepID=A0AAV1M7Q4_9NEOP
MWRKIAEDFEKLRGFPNCIGALDGKHFVIKAPANSGSIYFNYKHTFSIVLLALVDACYKFIAVDFGAYGRNSDGGIFAQCNLGKRLENGTLHVPIGKNLPGSSTFAPYVIVGDEAFPLKTYLMRPYPGHQATGDANKTNFNHRLSLARRLVENAFGILTQRFRIFQRRMKLAPENVDYIILSTCVLHNFLCEQKDYTGLINHSAQNAQPHLLNPLSVQPGRPANDAFADARAHILAYAACLRHGLIPNLLDGGHNARFNCRDAVWWWLQSIKQYCSEAPQGYALLGEPVARLFARDGEPAPRTQPLYDVMQEALDTHFQGLVFRERNAGRAIDAHMTDKGFNVQIGIDPETGFPFGGNDYNCGTWMDKMGSSEAAGTRGRPATPRDGSAVELVALAYSVAAWLAAQHRAARFPHAGVARRHRGGALTAWTYAQWAERIRRNFERFFWVPAAPSAADLRPDLVHRRAIYKDTHGATRPWADYQLRCNFPVAMAVAPELFDPKHAWLALDNVERLLLGPLGLKTLDPADWAYRGDYDNSNNSDDPNVAHGYNYHQGPEWVWPLGFYLRARLAFAQENGVYAKTVAASYAALAPLVSELRASPWRGVPELCNAGGAYCADSCRSQAWSSGTALEALHELELARRALGPAAPAPAD